MVWVVWRNVNLVRIPRLVSGLRTKRFALKFTLHIVAILLVLFGFIYDR